MTKGQRAMAVAMIYPGGSGKGANPKNLGLSAELIRQGRTVLEYAPDLAANVLSGAEPLDAAYKIASDRKTDPGLTRPSGPAVLPSGVSNRGR